MRRTTAAIAGTLSGAALLLAAKYGADASSTAAGQAVGQTGDLAPPGSAAAQPPGNGQNPPGNGNAASGNGNGNGNAANGNGNGNGAAGNGATGNGATGNGATGNGAAGNGTSGNTPARAANGLKDGVFRGNAVRNQYGPIQVTIQVAAGRVTNLTATSATTPATTAQVNGRALPLLRQAALTAQSARVDTVSGATFTSGSFSASLQSALTAARG
ncbi:FMN-binding protein [Actinomadura sp. 6N118]|uniref:FMN-binding protein n=1 Tax=Actinomadura sp. 6N118 TaxID=3375151 RepID=UPI0037977A03